MRPGSWKAVYSWAAARWLVVMERLEHKHSGIKYITPDERHRGADVKILSGRMQVYQLAREQHPERWSKTSRNWIYISEVYLNPEKEAA